MSSKLAPPTRLIVTAILLIVSRSAAQDATITIVAREQASPAMPLFWQPARSLDPKKACAVIPPDGRAIPAQVDERGRVWWWASRMDRGQAVTYRVQVQDLSGATGQGVRLEQVREGLIHVNIDGRLFTALNYAKSLPKPFLYPVMGPTAGGVTRGFPMKDVEVERQNKRQDHPHHRSLWTAWGDVKSQGSDGQGVDYWAEGPECGVQRVKRIVRTVSGPVFGQVEAEVEWITPAGHRQLTEYRTYTCFRGDESLRVIDVRVLFKFTDGEVTFGDTSEAGIVALRLATTLDEIGGGRIFNSNGQTGERQCWGQPADWCDYVGRVEDQTVGVAVLDSNANLNHPPRRHIRGYGLFAANPIGLSDFTNQQQTRSKTWKAGETAEFNCRIIIHRGDTQAADIADQYRAYGQPPAVVTR